MPASDSGFVFDRYPYYGVGEKEAMEIEERMDETNSRKA